MNICVVGYGMMGGWHSDALIQTEVCLHSLVGRHADARQAFARPYGYAKRTTHLDEAFPDPEIEVVIIANPCEQRAAIALASLAHGKHTLVEIPPALSLADSETIAAVARNRDLTLGLVHPPRLRPELIALRERLRAGHEHVRHVGGRFFIH